ncbi:hypothetical protein K438DRAFT_1784004 [Mycena galopus ATCC 62051]|nr:hypothetical protein K438DRAFT_1784004 [Mycena galopus ATCC 62051]
MSCIGCFAAWDPCSLDHPFVATYRLALVLEEHDATDGAAYCWVAEARDRPFKVCHRVGVAVVHPATEVHGLVERGDWLRHGPYAHPRARQFHRGAGNRGCRSARVGLGVTCGLVLHVLRGVTDARVAAEVGVLVVCEVGWEHRVPALSLDRMLRCQWRQGCRLSGAGHHGAQRRPVQLFFARAWMDKGAPAASAVDAAAVLALGPSGGALAVVAVGARRGR